MINLKIKSARESQGLSQRDLALKTGLSQGYIGLIETGKVNPSIKTLNKIADVLNVETSFFLEKEPGVLFDEYAEHFNLKEKEFLAQQKNRPWITLSKELSDKGLSPDRVKKLLHMVMEIHNETP